MIFVVLLSRKCGINPDNVATPIAASLGDLTTLSLLAGIAQVSNCYRAEIQFACIFNILIYIILVFQGLYVILLNPTLVWTAWAIIILFIILTPIFVYISYRNEYTRDVVKNGWFPIIAAMGISR